MRPDPISNWACWSHSTGLVILKPALHLYFLSADVILKTQQQEPHEIQRASGFFPRDRRHRSSGTENISCRLGIQSIPSGGDEPRGKIITTRPPERERPDPDTTWPPPATTGRELQGFPADPPRPRASPKEAWNHFLSGCDPLVESTPATFFCYFLHHRPHNVWDTFRLLIRITVHEEMTS